jgi:predicted RNA-binding Zn ribbon-like protein
MERGLRLGRRDREDGSPRRLRPGMGRAVERALDVDEARIRICAVSRAALEAVERGFRAARRNREEVSVVIWAPIVGSAVELALDVDEARIRICAVSRAA